MKIIVITLCFVYALFPVYARAGFILGVGVHQSSDKNVQIIKEIGINSIRNDFNWLHVEKKKGTLIIPQITNTYLQMTSRSNIAPLMVLDYGNNFYDKGGKPVTTEGIAAFANFSKFTAKELASKVNCFEIWNEWDNSQEPKSAESYFELLKAAAPAIKAINKNAVVLSGGATNAAMRNGWVERLIRLGALKYVDGISIHPYVQCDRDNRPEVWVNFVSQISEKMKKENGGKDVPLYITEMGWPSNTGACGTPPEKVAQYLARALLLVRTLPEVKGFWWYDLKNDGKNIEEGEHNFGLLTDDYTPKPAFAALRDVAPYVINAKTVVRQPALNGIVSLVITDNTGKKSFALWTENGKSINTSLSIIRERNALSSIIKIGTSKAVRIDQKSSTFPLTLDGTPQIIIGIQQLQIDKGH